MTEECKINKKLILENKPERSLEQKLKENILRKILKKQKAWNKPLKEQSVSAVSGQDHEKKASSKNTSSEEKARNAAKGKKKKKI